MMTAPMAAMVISIWMVKNAPAAATKALRAIGQTAITVASVKAQYSMSGCRKVAR